MTLPCEHYLQKIDDNEETVSLFIVRLERLEGQTQQITPVLCVLYWEVGELLWFSLQCLTLREDLRVNTSHQMEGGQG